MRGQVITHHHDEIDNEFIVLEAGRSARRYWRDLWRFRELFLILAWRDLAVRYKQTTMGVLWAVIRPLLTMFILIFVFGRIARLADVETVPYPVLVLAGMLPWFLFSGILNDGSNSLISNAGLIGKVYFPRMIVPLATVVVALTDLAISFVILVLLMVWFAVVPDWHLLLLPVAIAMGVFTSLGPSLLVAALNVRYRDFRFVIPFVLQCGLYLSPVGFTTTMVPERWRLLYSLNPLVGVIDAVRWCVLGGQTAVYWPGLVSSIAVSFSMLAVGIAYFRATERTFADHV